MPPQGFPQHGKRFEPKNMLFRYLGNTGLKVSVLGLGGWLTYGSDAGVKGVEQTAECLQKAWDHGINFFDTAEVYAEGNSEIIMGKALKQCDFERDDFVIATKLHFGDDVVYAHRADFWCTPMEETVRAFNTIIEKGQAHYWGTSEWSAFEIEHAQHVATRLGLQGPVVEQPQYNMFVRDRFENEYAPLYKLYNYGTTVWSPLYQGILTGKYNDGIPEDSRYATISKNDATKFESEVTKAQIAKVRDLTKIAEKLGGSMASLALAWVIKNPHISVAILGATKASQIEDNVKCLELYPKMTDEIMQEIEDILENKPKVPGTIPPTRMAMTMNEALK
ncbi:putative voltage-gated potassium channel subunit beta [Glarea lozoyensis 74030]|uniref:Putative voltage-gated potassium channel subunit beta n=1 Tax=Glarea lozoyensis (strain ATCC 74030 / MF5533) TaxID=1104152 RepID=H0EK69_GLAL7|nr:putative voltage-gated potassium channel subunit beta [Glarea lozoyensis 74030]